MKGFHPSRKILTDFYNIFQQQSYFRFIFIVFSDLGESGEDSEDGLDLDG